MTYFPKNQESDSSDIAASMWKHRKHFPVTATFLNRGRNDQNLHSYHERVAGLGGGYKVRVFENCLEVKLQSYAGFGASRGRSTSRRGLVSGFSAGSRRRMIKRIMMLRDTDSPSVFVTLTYPDVFPDSSQWHEWKLALKNFKRALEREFPALFGVWRLELKRRRSGTNAGAIAPHFHLLFFGASEDVFSHLLTDSLWQSRFAEAGFNLDYRTYYLDAFRAWVSLVWHRVTGVTDERHLYAGTNVRKLVGGWRHAAAYVSKYVAKKDANDDAFRVGRRWGLVGSPNARPYQNGITDDDFFIVYDRETTDFRDTLRVWASELVMSHRRKKLVLRNHIVANYVMGWQGRGFTVMGLGASSLAEIKSILAATAVPYRLFEQDLLITK